MTPFIPLFLTTAAHFLCATGLHQNPLTTLHQFPNGTSVENLTIRPNGHILITLLYSAEIHSLNPHHPPPLTPHLIHSFNTTTTTTTRLNGLSELTPDLFAIAANHNTIHVLDLRGSGPAAVSHIATIPPARFLNGLTTLNPTAGTVLAADSTAGAVWMIDTATGEFGVALQHPSMTPPNTTTGTPIGINGLRYRNPYLYYTNTGKQLFCRVRIDPATATAAGPYETLVTGFAGDDFALAPDGDAAYVASQSEGSGSEGGGSEGVVEKIFFNGTREVVAGGAWLAGATSAAFGRREADGRVLYVTTSGGGAGGGRVVAVEVA